MEDNTPVNPENTSPVGGNENTPESTPPPMAAVSEEAKQIENIASKVAEVKAELSKVLVGQTELIDLL